MTRFPIGTVAEQTVTVSGSLIDDFARVSGDTSRLHMDAGFARARGFRGRVAHGALLGALVSRLIGTELPGDDGVLQEWTLSFRQACCEGDEVVVRVEVSDVHDSVRAMTCAVTIRRPSGELVAKGHVRSGLTDPA